MQFDLVFDMQFGSTGKGLLCGYLGDRIGYDLYLSANGPNAGHTYIDANGQKFIFKQLPIGAALRKTTRVAMAPGAIIDVDTFLAEVAEVRERRRELGYGVVDIVVHEHAAVATAHDRADEARLVSIGSTMKGTGSAVARKIMRNADQRMPPAVAKYEERLAPFIITDTEYRGMVYDSKLVLAEGSQGFSLGINSGFYPYTTSRECTPMQIMSDMLLSPRHLRWNVGSMRTFPIRVANRFDSDGQMIGTSGPCYPDQRETSWEEIGVEPELTTVTKLVRRVFTFSEMQFEHALQVCKPSHVFLNFANYMPKEVQRLRTRLTGLISKHGCFIYRHSGIRWEGWGPSFMDVREINADYESDED